jgi:2-succinyl-5-enolpyruvyl-6-hydroxy-3-cyclohexene-1-carboxylate synthase
MTDATTLARAVVMSLVEAGVTEVVLAPGSRNAPLSFAAYDAAEAGLVRLHTRIDERTAGFLALGLIKVGARAAVMCTSGTAVANLHPAVLEAAHSGLPLVVVTADRPARLRGTSANQTTDQVGIFGPGIATIDLADPPVGNGRLADPPVRNGRVADPPAKNGRVDGPVHLNVQLEEPLVPTDRWAPSGHEPQPRDPETRGLGPNRGSGDPLPLGPRTVVVAGDDAGPRARQLAQDAGWPLLAEPSSGARTGPALRCYRLLLDGDLGREIERAVVFGHPTLSRPVSRLLGRSDVEVVDVVSGGLRRPFDVDRTVLVPAVEGQDDPTWLTAWQEADASVAAQLDQLLAAEAELTPHHVAAATVGALPPRGLLVVGASSPIRDLDLMARPFEVGSRRKVIANRGLSGIDGNVSTAVGAALGRPDSTRSIALMGDVTFLHDSNGLVLGPDEPRPDLTIVVVNDDGGSIFTMLEQGAEEHAHAYDRLFGTPHGVDLAALCAATRTPHWRVDTAAELEHALASPNGGIEVVEARVRRDNRRALDERIRALTP